MRAGRGGIAVSAAKLYFILVGLVQQVALKAVLGLEGYGALSSALAAASIAYNPVVTASLQGVSHAVATAPEAARPSALRRVLRVHALLALVLATAFWLFASPLGALTGAPHIVGALRWLSAVLCAYGLYAPLVGALNGQTRFGTQAALDALAATLRTGGLIGGALGLGAYLGSGRGVEGACAGFVVSSLLVLGVAALQVGWGSRGAGGPSLRAYTRFIAAILLGQGLLNLLFQADQLLIRRFSADAALAAGLAATAADPLVGAYRAVQLFCFLPYQLVLAVSTVLFPLVAKAQREGSNELVRTYVAQGNRTALLVTALITSVTCGLPGPLLTLVFGADSAALGTAAMGVLSLGLGCLALLGVFTSLLNSLERQAISLIVTGLAVVLVVGSCFVKARGLPLGAELLWQAACSTSLALFLATGVAGACLRRTAGVVLELGSSLRILVALGGAVTLARSLPAPSKLLTPVWCAAVAATYVALLLVLRELDGRDLQRVRKLVAPRRARLD